MNDRRRRILGYLGAFFSIDVLIASVLALILVWVGSLAANDFLDKLYTAGEKVTGVADQALNRVDNSLMVFGQKAEVLSNDISTVGKNVQDKGIIANLLPPDREQQLTDRLTEVHDAINQVKETVASVQNYYQALNALPFVKLPSIDQTPLQKLTDLASQIDGLIQGVKQGLNDLRSGVATAIQAVAAGLTQVNSAVLDARMQLAPIRGTLAAANQVILPALQAATPIVIFVFVVLITLMYAWTIFALWHMFNYMRGWAKGGPHAVTAAGKPVPIAAPAPAQPVEAATPAEPPVEPPSDQPKSD